MASSLPTKLIEQIDAKYIEFGVRVEEARKATCRPLPVPSAAAPSSG